MPPATATALLREHFALEPVALELLDTERDDSFRVTTVEGYFVLKVAHPADDPAVIEMQGAAMERASAAGLPVQRLVPTVAGATSVTVGGRVARVLTWLPGGLLADAVPDARQLFDLGAALGRLGVALREFEHPAAHRLLAWDLQRIGALREYTDDAALLAVIDRVGDLADLPHQVIHNDFHPGNLLVDDVGDLAGILDFGDAVSSARVCDLAVALAYFIPEEGDPWRDAAPFLAGFESVVPLLAAEHVVLRDLVAARLVMRVVIPSIVPQPRTDPLHYVDRNRRILENLLEGH